MGSLRATTACIGISGRFSVMKDFFGLSSGKVPQLAGAPTSLSLLEQMRALKGMHFHINMILVGSDLFTDVEASAMDFAVHKCRAIYKQADVGVGRIQYFAITVAEANGREIIDSDDEAADLTNEWTVHNNGLDVFMVRDYKDGLFGLSAIGGSCDKDNTVQKMSGSVVEISAMSASAGSQQLARTFAHEIGHYLGLSHRNNDPENLMCQSGLASNITTSVQLSNIDILPTSPGAGGSPPGPWIPSQIRIVRGHCFIQAGC